MRNRGTKIKKSWHKKKKNQQGNGLFSYTVWKQRYVSNGK